MPWKNEVAQRAELVALMETGTASVSELCRLYGVSRKTAYKWRKRFEEGGLEALLDASRAPHERPAKTAAAVERALIAARLKHPLWGARKVAAWLQKQHPEMAVPASSTCHDILVRHGLVKARRRHQSTLHRLPSKLTQPQEPNDVWSVDFKGHFRLGDGTTCYPLTLQDAHSRVLLRCDALSNTRSHPVRRRFESAFRAYGLPRVIRSDNGAPFAAPSGAMGWSKLSVWWERLDISHERISPGKPQQNGRHERMHRTLKKHTARPPRSTLNAQQRCFHAFRREFNEQRPHEALDMGTPSSVYRVSKRSYPERLPEVVYPGHFHTRAIANCGDLSWKGQRVYISEALQRERVGLEEIDDGLWRVQFNRQHLGLISEEHIELGLIRPGFKAYQRLLPMSPDDL